MGDSFAVLAPRVEGSLYPFSAGLLGGSHRLPSLFMVYIGFQLVSTGYLPDDEVASLVAPQKSWDVRDQKAFYVECRITLQHSESHAPDCLHKLYLVIWQWTVCMPGLEWRVFKHANGVRDSQQNHESFLDIAGGKSDGHAEGPRMWYQIEAQMMSIKTYHCSPIQAMPLTFLYKNATPSARQSITSFCWRVFVSLNQTRSGEG